MAPPTHDKSGFIPVNTWEDELEWEEEEGLCKHKRAKFSDSTVLQQQGIGVTATEKVKKENAAPLSLGVSASQECIDGAPDHVKLSSAGTIGSSWEHANGSTTNEPARLTLRKICSAACWKEPSYNFEEGPSHAKLFTCKVTIHVDSFTNTVLECTSEPNRQKEAAQEHAAQGALWYLKIFGHAN